ncbi:hypothetical protein ACIRRA_39575 [Nocardia sp. NPDC101769]|uniref:hypothetical protein n=2 Tax=unclassified Nocardia TaxID=2637762 RepID=UPI0038033051
MAKWVSRSAALHQRSTATKLSKLPVSRCDSIVADRRLAEFVHTANAAASTPRPEALADYWWGQTPLVDGVAQETCRDFAHTGYGVSAAAHIAETSRIQGRDLYPQVADRLRAGFELHARYQLGTPMPGWLCGGQLRRELGPVTEVAYNALHNRMHLDLPETERLTIKQRPAGLDMFTMWETLTHADNPA